MLGYTAHRIRIMSPPLLAIRLLTVVPVALFWRKGPRNQRRFLNLAYGAPTRPSDFAKVTSFLVNYRSMAVKVGEGIDIGAFVEARRDRRQTRKSHRFPPSAAPSHGHNPLAWTRSHD